MLQRTLLCCGFFLALFVTTPRAFGQAPAHRTPSRKAQLHSASKPQTLAQNTTRNGDAAKSQKEPQSPPQVPAQALSDEVPCALPSCAAFNNLIQAKDRTLSLNLYVPQAYACFNPQTDGFLVVSYSVSAVWTPENGEQISDGRVASDRYENGQDVDSDLAFGEWSAPDSAPGALSFHENSVSDNDSSFNVAVSDSLFTLSRNYTTIQGSAASLDLKISLPSLRFSESFSVDGKEQASVDNGQCWTYAFNSRTSSQPTPAAAATAQLR